jgi:hypothetical protein
VHTAKLLSCYRGPRREPTLRIISHSYQMDRYDVSEAQVSVRKVWCCISAEYIIAWWFAARWCNQM